VTKRVVESAISFLRTKGKRYRSRGGNKDKRGQIKNADSIEERLIIVDEKSRIWDWEIDTVIGKKTNRPWQPS